MTKESIEMIPVSELHDFPDHPFAVRDDDAMREITESTKEYGILTPITVRPRDEGGYEIISGHRRKHACELSGITEIPTIVRDCTRDEAIIMMVDSNLQRDCILPSEKGKAYKMKLEAIKRQGERTDLNNRDESTSCQVGTKLKPNRADEMVAEGTNESARNIQRYIRLNELNPKLQRLVDERKMGITPAVEVSYLSPAEQDLLMETIESEQTTPSLSQAQKMRKMSKEGNLNEDTILDLMQAQKKPEGMDIVLRYNDIKEFFPKAYTPLQMKNGIMKLLENFRQAQIKRARNQQSR